MARWIGALIALMLLLMLGSCPVPVTKIATSQNASDEPGAYADVGATAPDSSTASEYPPENTVPPGDGTGYPAGQVAPDAAQAGVPGAVAPSGPGMEVPQQQVGPLPGADVSSAQEQTAPGSVGPQQQLAAPSAGNEQQSAQAQIGPVPPQQPAPQYGALDAENFMGDAPQQSVWGQPKPKLSEDALSFAGRWTVAVIHRQGEARMLENNAEWVLELGRDGAFFARQDRGGQTWRQSGTWELNGMQLLLHSGPGGERSYELTQEMENICILRDPARETALFCVRDRAGVQPGAVQAKYDTDFGILNLRPAGPGHWRGSYGEPSGELLLAQLGSSLVGTWAQAPSKGFVLLELRSGGFAGAWLYSKSVNFDGRWVGVASQ
jgi:hypothetical protein